jgi:hypothetical protein
MGGDARDPGAGRLGVAIGRFAETQISPLRFAPVEMTNMRLIGGTAHCVAFNKY